MLSLPRSCIRRPEYPENFPMKYFLFFFLFFCVAQDRLTAQEFVTSAEAEEGVLAGTFIAPATGSSSGPYVTGFDNTGDKVTVSVSVPSAANYKLRLRYRSIYGSKTQDIYTNGVFAASVIFPLANDFTDLDAGTVLLNAGINTITMQKNWGYMDVDKFSLYTVPANVFNITASLIDAQATLSTKDLYAFLLSQFGNKTISGSTNDYYENIKTLTGKSPLLRAWDMASYSPMYPYNWANGGFAFGPVDNHDVENAISWYNSTNKKGIVAFHWHWASPSGGTVGTNTFYTTNTTFDISKAVINGTQENIDAIRDIDAIAVQLKKLSDANVPVLWRPLHEAGGGWFWWGAKGSAPAMAMWDIMYDRMTNYHGLHNLIWVWSTPEADWYPGNNKTDIIGFDSYPGEYNYTTQKTVFDNLYAITTGNKLIAMSENGPIPDIENAINLGAPWSYFMTWSDLAFSQNSSPHIQDVYNNAKVITLENYTVLAVSLLNYSVMEDGLKAKIEWTTSSEKDNAGFEIERSGDGINFSKICSVKGQRNTNSSHRYLYYDEHPFSGVNYYRLVQINTDGKRFDHGIKMVRFGQFKPTASLYPNPLTTHSGILLNNFRGNKLELDIHDLTGKLLSHQTFSNAGPGKVNRLLNVENIPAGVYLLKVKGKDLNETIKVVKASN